MTDTLETTHFLYYFNNKGDMGVQVASLPEGGVVDTENQALALARFMVQRLPMGVVEQFCVLMGHPDMVDHLIWVGSAREKDDPYVGKESKVPEEKRKTIQDARGQMTLRAASKLFGVTVSQVRAIWRNPVLTARYRDPAHAKHD